MDPDLAKRFVTLEKELAKQQELSDWIDSITRREFLTEEPKHLIAMSCFDLVIEHHAAIVLLCQQKFYGSMFALYRIIFESLIRGMYFLYCADEEIIRRFEKGKISNFGDLIIAVEKAIDLSSGILSSLKSKSYGIMNDFTHTGYQHLVRRNADGFTGHMSYPQNEIHRILQSSGSLLLMAASCLAELSSDKSLQASVLVKVHAYANDAPN